MAVADTAETTTRAAPARAFSAWWLVGWAIAAALLVMAYGAAVMRLDLAEPDNGMRLVQVRDLIAGQAWFDDVQHRLNPPDGTSMHWARWLDAVIAAPIVALTPIMGQANAEVVTAFAWPLSLLVLFMWLVSKVCAELAGEKLASLARIAGPVIAAFASPVMEKFAPGQLDHHNIQLICAMAALLGLMRMAASPMMGLMAGAVLGFAMGTAAEAVPLVIAGCGAAGLMWLFQAERHARGLALFGAGLAAVSLVMFVMLVPPARWSLRVCDAMSPAFLGFGLGGGAVAMALGMIPSRVTDTLIKRAGASVVLAGVAGVALVKLFPECSGGGYTALSPEMMSLWMAQIGESRSLIGVAMDDFGFMISLVGAALTGVVAACMFVKPRRDNAKGWAAAMLLAAGWGLFAWQIRGAAFATAFAIPFLAWAVARAYQMWKATPQPNPRGLLIFALVSAASLSAAWNAVGMQVRARLVSSATLAGYEGRVASSGDCTLRDAIAPLNDVKPGLIMLPFAAGVSVLQFTPHSVTAAPYHRDVAGITTMIEAMRSSPDAARALVLSSRAVYVLACAALPETQFYAEHPRPGVRPRETLSYLLGKDAPPAWLVPVALSAETPVRLYKVVR